MEDLKHVEARIASDFEKVAEAIKDELCSEAFRNDAEAFTLRQNEYKYLTKLINRFNNSKEGT
jgi:hypothetical protein